MSMKIPPIGVLARFVVSNRAKTFSDRSQTLPAPLEKDTVSFSSSTAYYLKLYDKFPKEIKGKLKPKDAIDMLKNFEMIANGRIEGTLIEQGNFSKIYENPWLREDGYYFLISRKPDLSIKNSVWKNNKNPSLQIIKKAS